MLAIDIGSARHGSHTTYSPTRARNPLTGNHDMWVRDYFQLELGVKVITEPQQFIINGKSFLIGHGDGLGPGDTSYKLMKKYVTSNRLFRWLFGWIHPDIGVKLGQFLSSEKKIMSAKKISVMLKING